MNDVKQQRLWGYRKYRHGAIPDALKRFEGTDRVTPAAQALIVYVDVKKRAGVLRLLSTNADDTTANQINEASGSRP